MKKTFIVAAAILMASCGGDSGSGGGAVSVNSAPSREQDSFSVREKPFLTGEILHNGLVYNTVRSPVTGRTWLDRNLGAKKVCESFDDENCYGDYFQWGRSANGHEKVYSEVEDHTRDGRSGVVKDVKKGGKFVTWKPFDWKAVQDNTLWQGVNGKNNPCPKGYRVPTRDEILAETTNAQGAQNLGSKQKHLDSFLKLPTNGFRKHDTRDGIVEQRGYVGNLWTSSTSDSRTVYSFWFDGSGSGYKNADRATGYGVRCIKDESAKATVRVIGTTPYDGQTGVAVNAQIMITFSGRVLTAGREHFVIRNKASGAEAAIANIYQVNPFMLKLLLERGNSRANGGLEPNAQYELIVKAGLPDAQNTTLPYDYKITFKTGSGL
ncbi:MAG: Ig-like domain-containing protein [Helicobacteraceae bacterium]